MRQLRKATQLLGALGALAWLGGCEDHSTGPSRRGIDLPVFAVIASDPAGAFNASIAATVAGSGYSVTFVSLAPGTVVRGSSVEIRNLASGFTRTEGLVEGGLDPVPMPASVGDTLQLTVTDGSEITSRALVVVAPRRPPRVVRTEPPPKKRDVVLNARMLVVFSEPVDPATVSTTNIRLIQSGVGGVVVNGQVTLAPDGLTASYQPDAALLPGTDYTLVVEARMRDLDGDALSQAVTVTFTTSAAGEIAPEIATWVSRASAPTVRTNAATAVVDGIIYLVGGDDAAWADEELVTTVEAYHPATNTWTTKAPMPTPRSYLAAAVVNGIIYAVGGLGGELAVEAYDPVTDSWTARASMPTALSNIIMGVVNGILYAVGGNGTLAYDPVANSWTTRATMPTARWSAGIGVVNGILYAVGGWTSDGFSTTAVEAYDPVTNTWTSRPPMPTSRANLGVGVVNNIVYAAGGNSWPPLGGNSREGAVEAYDPATNSWRAGPPLPIRYTTLVAVVDDVIYAVIASQIFAYQP